MDFAVTDFSAAGFAHNCERLTFLERKLYTADCLYFTGIGVIRDYLSFLLPESDLFCSFISLSPYLLLAKSRIQGIAQAVSQKVECHNDDTEHETWEQKL